MTAVTPRRALALFLSLLVLAAFALGPGRTLIPGMGGIPVAADAVPTGVHGPSGLLIRLNVDYDQGPDHGFGRHTADYLSDGTVIRWTNAGAACEPGMSCGILERNTLTSAGLAAVRALLEENADLLSEPATIEPHFRADAQPSGRPDVISTFILEQPDGTRYTVSAPSATSYDAPNWAPTPAVDRLNALAAALVDPASVVGTDGLADPTWAIYAPEKTAMFISIQTAPSQADPTPIVGQDGTVSIPFSGPRYLEIGWPFEGTPDTFGAAFSGRYGIARCAFLPSTDAVSAINSLPAVLASDVAPGYLASGSDWRSGSGIWRDKVISLTAVSLLPEDVAGSCADALAY
jgi:hypothetical protein